MAAPGDRLRAVLAVTRLSDRHTDKGKLEKLSKRNKELADFAIAVHRESHACLCNPVIHDILLNGVASNTNAGASSAALSRIQELRDTLADLSGTPVGGIVTIVVSSVDGLWTNVYGFANFFSAYVQKIPLTYLIHEGNASYQQFSVLDIFHAIQDVLRGPLSKHQEPESESHQLVRQWITIAYNKHQQREGNVSVRAVMTQQRNTSVIDITSEQPLIHVDSATRVTRIIRSGGTDFDPLFRQEEEKRYTLQKVAGKLKCPEKHCQALFIRREELVHHILQNILKAPQEERKCPLCPPDIAKWNFIYIADAVYHLLRHVSPHNPRVVQDKNKAQCPFCFVLLASTSVIFRHIEFCHLRALEVRWAAVSAGLITRANAAVNDAEISMAVRIRNRKELAALPTAYRDLTTDIPQQVFWSTFLFNDLTATPTGNPLPDMAPFNGQLLFLANILQGASATMQSHKAAVNEQPKGKSQQKWFMKFSDKSSVTPNQRRKAMQAAIETDDNNRTLCPLEAEVGLCGCGKYFNTNKKLCEHILSVLRITKASLRQCPWCPSNANILKSLEKPAANNAKDIGDDLRHMLRHFPPDIACPLCGHLSRCKGDMMVHRRALHFPWHCEVQGCKADFGTQEELSVHQRAEH